MKEYIVCIDSDGCAMDTMTVKHEKFFGPLAADYFDIKDRDVFLQYWEKVNLYSKTRGINRFKGLKIALTDAQKRGEIIPNMKKFYDFVETSLQLSNDALEEVLKMEEDTGLKLALEWSKEVNSQIEKNLFNKDRPFDGVYDTVKKISEKSDIAIVSSANNEAITSEWSRHGLMDFVNYVFGQEEGTKEYAISEIIKKGYELDNIIMLGDAIGDEDAAFKNGVKFFPIIIKNETLCWEKFAGETYPIFLEGKFDEEYQDKLLVDFHNALNS